MVALALPGYLALGVFALMAGLQSAHLDPPDSWILLTMPIGLVGVLSWALAPFFVLIGLAMLFLDRWRGQRPRRERILLRLWVLGSPVAWIFSNVINDAAHLLR